MSKRKAILLSPAIKARRLDHDDRYSPPKTRRKPGRKFWESFAWGAEPPEELDGHTLLWALEGDE